MRVSIIIPCYDVQEHLPGALGSALAQDHPDTEIICVDDGSKDGTRRVLADFSASNPGRIRILEQTNKGASAARNAGAVVCTGAYIQFLDADDTILPDKISGQVQLAERHASPGLIVGDFEQVDVAKAFCQQLREAGYASEITSDWSLDDFGAGDIALRVHPEEDQWAARDLIEFADDDD